MSISREPHTHTHTHTHTHLHTCRYSLSRSDKAVAALVCTLYPKFPNSSTDNRYHLQALRHLYVLAAEPRVLVTRDVRTGQACSVSVTVKSGEEKKGVTSRTPCIVPEWNYIREVCVVICQPFLFLCLSQGYEKFCSKKKLCLHEMCGL